MKNPNPITKDTKELLEAVKLAADWCKWLVTIETAAIAAIGVFIKYAKEGQSKAGVTVAIAAVILFVASIIVACLLMFSLPEIAQSLIPGESVWSRKDQDVRIKLSHLALFHIITFMACPHSSGQL